MAKKEDKKGRRTMEEARGPEEDTGAAEDAEVKADAGTPEDAEEPEEAAAEESGTADEGDPLREEIRELQDKVMRQMAEFENFRKRTDKEKAQMFDTGASHVITKILPVVDNFERGLASAPEGEAGKAFAEGMGMIYKQLIKALEDLGVTAIEALGKEFDPGFHNAVMQTEATEDYPSGTVSQELQKGYLYHDVVIRHSMVAVSE